MVYAAVCAHEFQQVDECGPARSCPSTGLPQSWLVRGLGQRGRW